MNLNYEDVEQARVDRDGCDCPPWVVRCVHVDGDMRLVLGHPDAAKCSRVVSSHYVFTTTTAPSKRCDECGEADWWLYECTGIEQFDNETDALEAFHAAEEELLRGPA